MIQINIEDMMWRRRIRSISRLARRAGLSRQTVDALYNRPQRVKGIRFETLDGLCRALDCGIEDLIRYVPESDPTAQSQIGEVGNADPESDRVDVVRVVPTGEDAQPMPPSR